VRSNTSSCLLIDQVLNGALAGASYDNPQSLEATADIFSKKAQFMGFDSHHIHLNVLTQENVKDCIRMALKKRGLLLNGPISENHVNDIIKHTNYKLEGCKSVWNNSASVVF